LGERYSLSEREKDVLFYLCYFGYSNADIARHLYVSEFTVRRHISSIRKKCGSIRIIQSKIIQKLADSDI
jgi:DNA-binding NarL/FixJ family response regulator